MAVLLRAPPRRPARALLLGIVATLALNGCNAPAETPSSGPRPALPVQAYEVANRDITRSVMVSGTVEPLRNVRLAAQTSGILTHLEVEAGDRVTRGSLLATIDVREQQAELSRAEAELREQDSNLARLRRLQAQGHIDTASVEVAETQLQRSRSEVELWQTRVAYGDLHSTLDGVVIERHAEPGEALTQYQPVLTIADTTTLVVRFGFSELDVASLAPGMPIPVRIDAVRDRPELPGHIRRIMPTTTGASRLVTVEVELQNSDDMPLRLGYLARANVVVESREQVLAVPLGSVTTGANGAFVMTIDEEARLRRREVVPGPARGNWREILGGLAPGDVITTASPADLAERQRVRIVGWLNGEEA